MYKEKTKRHIDMSVGFGLDFSILEELNSNKKIDVFQTHTDHNFGLQSINVLDLWNKPLRNNIHPKISFTYKGRLPYNKVYNYLYKLPNTKIRVRGLPNGLIAYDLIPKKIEKNNKKWWNMVSKAISRIK